jgi:pimeloyl-ACP methyl ester carboxylesterase
MPIGDEEQLMPFREEKVSVRNGMFNVSLRRGGSGEPLVYLHAAAGQPAWEPFLEMLSQKYDVIQPSHPGWPGSDGLERLDDVVDMALFYLDFFDTLGLRSVNLVGTSLGGMFAAEIAALGKSYVNKLVLSEPAGLWLDDHQPLDMFVATQDELTQALYVDPEEMAKRRPPVDPDNKEAVAKAMLDRQMAMAATSKFVWPIWDKGLKRRIHRISARTMIIWGDKDGVIPPVYGPEFQRLIPGSRLEVIENTAHAPMSERPEEWVRLVSEFLG